MRRPARAGGATLAAVLVLASIQGARCGDRSAAGLKPDPEFQASIEQAVAAVVKEQDAAPERIERLQKIAAGRRETLLLQMALYLEGAAGTEESMAGALIVQRLAFTPEEKLEAVLPHLETAGPGLRKVFTELLGTIDRPEGGEPDFRLYEARILKDKGSPPPALIRYLYEVSPDAALRSMSRVYGGKEVGHDAEAGNVAGLQELLARDEASPTWSSEDRSRARAALDALSRDRDWWVRLYVAAVLNRVPDLATPALRDRLRDDPEALVRDAHLP